MRKIIPYHPYLVILAKKLRNNMTYAEIALWREIKNKKLGVRFSRQIPIDRYIVDFYCKDLRLAVEVDGSVHFEEGNHENDLKRQTRLESLGVRLIRFSNPDVKNNLSWVLDEIRKEIEGWVNHKKSPCFCKGFFHLMKKQALTQNSVQPNYKTKGDQHQDYLQTDI
ncbi:endonuclease domain-containing protein [Muriicola sp. E247]|uniref:endonuclease domain-containing protein n=1 Tax=Muriicola sp. E247 TaxID=3242730 RepID=UPI003525891D